MAKRFKKKILGVPRSPQTSGGASWYSPAPAIMWGIVKISASQFFLKSAIFILICCVHLQVQVAQSNHWNNFFPII